MGIANLPAGFFGAVPMCHGTGGLAAHYRFSARTGGAPVMIGALLLTLVLIFAFQAENLTRQWFAVLLIAVPILIQVYFNSGLWPKPPTATSPSDRLLLCRPPRSGTASAA